MPPSGPTWWTVERLTELLEELGRGAVLAAGPADASESPDAGAADAGADAAGLQPDAGHPDAGEPPDAGPVCPYQSGITACDLCIIGQCSTSCSTCRANRDCADLAACPVGCGPDALCQQNCTAQHAGGATDFNAVVG